MRLAFIDAKAEYVAKRRRRRRHWYNSCRKNQRSLIRECVVTSSIYADEPQWPAEAVQQDAIDGDGLGKGYQYQLLLSRLRIRPNSQRNSTHEQRLGSDISPSDPDYAQPIDASRQRLRIYYGSLLAAWHTTSILLFFLSTLVFAAAMNSENSPPSNLLNTPAKRTLLVLDSTHLGASCSKYEYFLSSKTVTESPLLDVDLIHESTAADVPSYSKSPTSGIVKRSVSPFYAPSPVMDNVFSIWLRASRSSRTSLMSPYENVDLASSMYALPSNPRTRHRYQYYYNDLAGASEQTTPLTTTGTVTMNSVGSDDDHLDKHRPTAMQRILQCELFDEKRIEELCSLETSSRVKKLRHVYIRTNLASNVSGLLDASNNYDHSNASCTNSNPWPLTLYDFFKLTIRDDGDLMRPNLSHLAANIHACIHSSIDNSSATSNWTGNGKGYCRACYGYVLKQLKDVEDSHRNFSVSVLSMIDCEPDNDLERFSPTSNCSDCKIWYRRWLLVILTSFWRQKPCLQWCHLAELACPHLPPLRKNDYAGLPSFRCTDPEIASWFSNPNSSYDAPCECMHPCDPSAPTIRWGWNVSAERPHFCHDYQRQERRECKRGIVSGGIINTKHTTSPSTSTSATSRIGHDTSTENSKNIASVRWIFRFRLHGINWTCILLLYWFSRRLGDVR